MGTEGRPRPGWTAAGPGALDDVSRAALEWGLASGTDASHELVLRLLGALSRFYWTRDNGIEALQWYARALRATSARTAARMKALHGAAWLAHFAWDSTKARELLDESLSIACELGDEWTTAWVLHLQGRVAYFDGDHVRAAGA